MKHCPFHPCVKIQVYGLDTWPFLGKIKNCPSFKKGSFVYRHSKKLIKCKIVSIFNNDLCLFILFLPAVKKKKQKKNRLPKLQQLSKWKWKIFCLKYTQIPRVNVLSALIWMATSTQLQAIVSLQAQTSFQTAPPSLFPAGWAYGSTADLPQDAPSCTCSGRKTTASPTPVHVKPTATSVAQTRRKQTRRARRDGRVASSLLL